MKAKPYDEIDRSSNMTTDVVIISKYGHSFGSGPQAHGIASVRKEWIFWWSNLSSQFSVWFRCVHVIGAKHFDPQE